MTTQDPVVEEVRAAREKLFEACKGDLDELLNQLKEQEQQDEARLVSRRDVRTRRGADAASTGYPDAAADPASVRRNQS